MRTGSQVIGCGACFGHLLVEKDPIPSGMWGPDSSWHKVGAQPEKISQVGTWGKVPVKYTTLGGVMTHAFEE